MRGEIESMIDQFGLQERVRITGFLSNQGVHDELLAARVLVLPSFAEGLPVAIMEALALGRPVISTYVAGIPELVEQDINGWLVPAGAVEPLANAMIAALIAAPSMLERMGRAGAARVNERHSIRVETGKLATLFATSSTMPRQPDQTCSILGALSRRQIPQETSPAARATVEQIGLDRDLIRWDRSPGHLCN